MREVLATTLSICSFAWVAWQLIRLRLQVTAAHREDFDRYMAYVRKYRSDAAWADGHGDHHSASLCRRFAFEWEEMAIAKLCKEQQRIISHLDLCAGIEQFGPDIAKACKLSRGVVYVLDRLEHAGLISSRIEQLDEGDTRLPRRLYRRAS
jgi:hypothetical protein